MSNKHFIGKRLFSFSDNGLRDPVSRVTLLVDDNNSVTAGDDTGLELLANCPYADDTLAQALLNQAKGYQYRAFNAQSADLDPAAELGDGVTVDGVYSVLAGITDKGDGYPDIFAPGDREEEDEYPEGGPLTRLFNRQLAQTRSLISKNSGSIELLVERTDGLGEQYSELSVSLSSISGRVEGVEGEFAAFLLDTDAFYVMDESGNRTAIRGSSIDVSTLNVQQINFSGAISFADLTGTDDLLTDVDTALGYADDAMTAADRANADIAALADGEYYDGTFIDGDRMIAPRIYAGRFYATGEGRNSEAAYYIYDSYNQRTDTLGNKVGYLSYDTDGIGSEEEAAKRVLLTTLNGTALKLQSDGNMSIAANRIYMMSDTQFSGVVILESECCGSSLPDESDAINGQLFFLFE